MKSLIDFMPKGIVATLSTFQRAFLRNRKVGKYQEALLANTQCWAGRDLRGKAGDYASRYRRAAVNLYSDIRLALRKSNWYAEIVPNGGKLNLVFTTVKSNHKKKYSKNGTVARNSAVYSIVRASNDALRPLFLAGMGVWLERASDRKRVANLGKLRLELAKVG